MTPLIFIFQLLIAVPVAIVLALTSVWYIWESGNTVLYASFAQKMFSGIENYGLLAIPLFMLTGELMNEGGMTRRLINAARVFVGGFRGGLAYINLLANMFMAAIIGSATAQIAVMSRAMVPEMEKEGYDKGFAAATTAGNGSGWRGMSVARSAGSAAWTDTASLTRRPEAARRSMPFTQPTVERVMLRSGML